MLLEIIIGALTSQTVAWSFATASKLLENKAAKLELAEICVKAIESASAEAPELAEDLSSESFVVQVLVPSVKSSVEDPSVHADSKSFQKEFIEMFVSRFAKAGDVDEALRKIFQTDPASLEAVFSTFLQTLKSGLYASEHWKAEASYQTIESNSRALDGIQDTLNQMALHEAKKPLDLAKAQADAYEGSTDLREWPKEIFGGKIARPAFDRVLRHIEEKPAGTSFLLGDAGSGKSALMAELTEHLEQSGVPVFAIKADMLSEASRSIADLEKDLGLEGGLLEEISVIADAGPTVVLIDQLDAVSEVMDKSANRMRLLIGLVRKIRRLSNAGQPAQVHVVVSSRPFEAAHDARFKQLQPDDTFDLELPKWDEIAALLDELGIDPDSVGSNLRETLRRPFALKLYVEIVKRGEAVQDLEASELLDRWLATSKLGDPEERKRCLELMTELAQDMIRSEAIWRPADHYEATRLDALRRCEAAGLIVRQGPNIGFSHQSWLDDFQAKSFSTGNDLADYAWEKQDSLFARSTVLRSLQRLRAVDIKNYRIAVDVLLSSQQTRRHVKHLLTDIISATGSPDEIEASWVERFIREDTILALRALPNAEKFWPAWRDSMKPMLPILMDTEETRWIASAMLSAEMRQDPDYVMDLVEHAWDASEFDRLVFRIFEEAELLTERVKTHLGKIFSRSQIDSHGVSHFIRTLTAASKFSEAGEVLSLWIDAQDLDKYRTNTLYDLHKFAEKSPATVIDVLLPWFVEQAEGGAKARTGPRSSFDTSDAIPWDWDDPVNQDSPYAVLELALRKQAEEAPEEVWRSISPYLQVEIEQVQELIAGTLAAAGESLAAEAFDFLMADYRRLEIGNPTVALREGTISSAPGLVSQELVEAISPHLSDEMIERLVQKIESWERYKGDEFDELDAEDKRARLRWTEEARKRLLERLPQEALTPRRQRQIKEWRAKTPRHRGRSRNHMAGWVGSPMNHEEMADASDDAIFGILEKINDVSREGDRFSLPVSRSGGVVEVSRAFGAFGKEHPERAIEIARSRLVAGRHEYAAGELVDELSGKNDKAGGPSKELAADVFDLTHELSAKGFSSPEWRQRASWAFARLARKLGGLPDRTIEMLEGWLECDPDLVAGQIKERLEFEERNSHPEGEQETHPSSIMFDGGFGGMRVLPNDNYTILSAIHSGLINREKSAFDEWLAILTKHLERSEDPAIWQAVLAYHSKTFLWADRQSVQEYLRKIWALDKSIFDRIEVAISMWPIRDLIPDDLIAELFALWLASSNAKLEQCAAEIVTAASLVDPDNEAYSKAFEQLVEQSPPSGVGVLLAAAAAWRQDNRGIRERAHQILMTRLPEARGQLAEAVAHAVSGRERLIPDGLTQELLLAILANEDAFNEALGYNFSENAQGLLLHSEFDELLLDYCQRAAELLSDRSNQRIDRMLGESLVQICVSLMRNDAGTRSRAMDIYESLLDQNAYGAEQAAQAAVGR